MSYHWRLNDLQKDRPNYNCKLYNYYYNHLILIHIYAHNNIYIIIIIYYDLNDLNYYSRICFLSTYAESHSQSLLQATVNLDSGHFYTLFNSNQINYLTFCNA